MQRFVAAYNYLLLTNAHAITVHKSQGTTLQSAVVALGTREFAPGLTFVALSRVKTIKDLAFTEYFNFNRLSNLGKSKSIQERLVEDQRLRSLEPS